MSMQARPTMYAGVLMKSRTEASFAQWLDKRRWNWQYWERTPGFCFAGPSGQYLPDFRILFYEEPSDGMFVELKPTAQHAWDARLSMMPIFDTYPNATLIVVAPYGNYPDQGFHCYGFRSKDQEWMPSPQGYWPRLPERIPGPCRCGCSWIDPEYRLCEPCWRNTCFSCGGEGTILYGTGPDMCESCWQKLKDQEVGRR